MLKTIFIVLCMICLNACANEQIENSNIKLLDSAGGLNPTMPLQQEKPALISGEEFALPQIDSTNSTNPPLLGANSAQSYVSDFVTLLNPGGAALTVWALAKRNWVWGYTLIDSISFGDARTWQFIELENNAVMIKNAKTLACLEAYGNGVIHDTCNQSNNMQIWKLIPMDNQAVQIKNMQTHRCLQAPIDDILGDFHKVFGIYQNDCTKPGEKNFDQQWYIIAPATDTLPLYTID